MRIEPRPYSINDFREWSDRKELELSPKFQRRQVWSEKARSYLIDTIIRGLPIGKIFMRHDVDPKTRKSIREVVDGQQRIRAILNFLDDGFTILKAHNDECAGLPFSQLPIKVQRDFLNYPISVDVILGAEDKDVLDIFARLNTYTVKLNKQELRNAKYFGPFKQTVFSLGHEFANFLTENKVLTWGQVARMAEAELASELAIIIIDGIQDRKNIESYYIDYDEQFPEKDKVTKRFKEVMDTISEIMEDRLAISKFSSVHLFYSLFGVIYDLKFGISEPVEKALSKKDYPKISAALDEVDYILKLEPKEVAKEHLNFYDASTKHVTDLSRRKIRHNFIKEIILGKLS